MSPLLSTSTPLAFSTAPHDPPTQSTAAPRTADSSIAFAILQTVKQRQFSSLVEASTYLKSLSPEDRFEVVTEQAAKLVDVQERVDKYMEYLEKFVENDDTFNNRMKRDPDLWQKVYEGASRARSSLRKKQQALNKCFERW